MLSRHGPALAVADVDGDGLDDVFVGGGAGTAGQLFLQRKDGRFVAPRRPALGGRQSPTEDWGALFFDANGDGRPDLYVASGGYQLAASSPLLQDRLYINQGGGRFVRDSPALPKTPTLTSTATRSRGGLQWRRPARSLRRRTPQPSAIAAPDPKLHPPQRRRPVHRRDRAVAPELVKPGGMITDAAWVDFDGDGKLDLVTAGEWMPIQFYRNDGARLRDVTASTGLPSMRGWWSSLAVGDFDDDGRPDLVAGNLGLNYSYTTSKDSIFGVYAGDFPNNLGTDVVLTQHIGKTE